MTDEIKAAIAHAQANTLVEHLGIEVTELQDGLVEATMPVDHRTHQPMGLLHGGATAALMETIGSFGSHFLVYPQGLSSVGVELNVNHLKSARTGHVIGKATILHLGKRLHVWQLDVYDQEENHVATGRLTVMVVDPKTHK